MAALAAPPCKESLRITIGFLGILLGIAVRMGLMPLPRAGDYVSDGLVASLPLEAFTGFVDGGNERGGVSSTGGLSFGGDGVAGDFATYFKDF